MIWDPSTLRQTNSILHFPTEANISQTFIMLVIWTVDFEKVTCCYSKEPKTFVLLNIIYSLFPL